MIRGAQVVLILSWLTCVIGLALIVLVDTESVIGTGPVLFVLGVVLLALAGAARYRWAAACAAGHIALPLFWTLLVNMFDWSPDEAHWPFVIMGSGYVAAVTLAGIYVLLNPPRLERSPWECRQCGYLLYGLPSGDCPECGVPFERPPESTPPPM